MEYKLTCKQYFEIKAVIRLEIFRIVIEEKPRKYTINKSPRSLTDPLDAVPHAHRAVYTQMSAVNVINW